jgi:hypothetical protein
MHFSIYTTVELARLRAFVNGENIEELNSFRDKISILVMNALQCLENQDQKNFVSVCFQLWELLSTFPTPYQLPPKYTGNRIESPRWRI